MTTYNTFHDPLPLSSLSHLLQPHWPLLFLTEHTLPWDLWLLFPLDCPWPWQSHGLLLYFIQSSTQITYQRSSLIILSTIPPLSISQWLSTRQDSAPWGHWTIGGDIFGYHIEGFYWHLGVEVKEAAKHPARHRTLPEQRTVLPNMPRLRIPALSPFPLFFSVSFVTHIM